jgi:hypothetical protein
MWKLGMPVQITPFLSCYLLISFVCMLISPLEEYVGKEKCSIYEISTNSLNHILYWFQLQYYRVEDKIFFLCLLYVWSWHDEMHILYDCSHRPVTRALQFGVWLCAELKKQYIFLSVARKTYLCKHNDSAICLSLQNVKSELIITWFNLKKQRACVTDNLFSEQAVTIHCSIGGSCVSET